MQLLQAKLGLFTINDLLLTALDSDDIDRLNIPSFYSQSLKDLEAMKPPVRSGDIHQIMGQPLWHNKHIRIGGKPTFYAALYRRGIRYISDIYRNGEAVSPPAVLSRLDQYKYWCVIHAVPQAWRETLRANSGHSVTEEASQLVPKINVHGIMIDMQQAVRLKTIIKR